MIYSLLSKSQKKIADKLILGLTNEQIALQLGVTVSCVKFHLTDCYKKTGAKSCREFIVKLLTEKLTGPKADS